MYKVSGLRLNVQEAEAPGRQVAHSPLWHGVLQVQHSATVVLLFLVAAAY